MIRDINDDDRRFPPMADTIHTDAAAVTSASRPRWDASRLWILSTWRDLLLFVATPALIVPAFWAARSRWTWEDIALFVAAFGALGHHLPGMMRAYGDAALFRRFRTRFILAPVFLASVCAACTFYDMSVIVLVAYLWGVWHGLMQTYGFARIYDARTGSFAARTARLDRAMCLAWFGAAVILSPTRLWHLLNLYHVRCGGPLIGGLTAGRLRAVAALTLAVVTLLFLVNLARSWRRGQPPSPIKLALMATSFGFWWYSNVVVDNMLVGVALFEVFHDVQYLAIVWIFNRSRVEKDPAVGSFTRFVFRRSGALAGVYVGMVFGYGSLALIARGLPDDTVRRFMQGLLVASGLLHFYFDGFIWKVRERSTRENLGLKGGAADAAAGLPIPAWVRHGLVWSVFLVPAFGLTAVELGAGPARLDRALLVAGLLPGSADAHNAAGDELAKRGRLPEGVQHLEKAVQLNPEFVEARNNLGVALAQQGRLDEAMRQFEAALSLKPAGAEALTNMGMVHARRGDFDVALDYYRRALAANPRHDAALENLQATEALMASGGNEALAQTWNATGIEAATAGRPDEAVRAFRRALEFHPAYLEAYNNLGVVLAGRGLLDEAAAQYARAMEIDPDYAPTHNNFGKLRAGQGRFDAAESYFQRAIALDPDFAEARVNLGKLYVVTGRAELAAARFQEALVLRPGDAEATALLQRIGGAEAGAPPTSR